MAYTLQRPKRGRRYWTVKIRLPGQKLVELSTKCTTKTDAAKVARRLHAERAASETRVPLVMAIETLIGLRTRQKRSPATIEVIEEKGAQLCRFFGMERDVADLRLADTTAYVQHRAAQGVSNSTIAKEMGVLRAALRYLVKLEQYDRLPDAIWPPELPHGSGKRSRWLTWDEHLQVLAALPAEWRDGFVVYCHCGLRYSELYRLEASHVGADGMLGVPGTKTTNAVRRVPINSDASEVLRRRAEEHSSGPLFPVKRKPKTQKAMWLRALGAACERVGVAHASTNDLRRTFCSWACQNGVAELQLVQWMGHGSRKMIEEVYAQFSAEQQVAEVAKMPSRKRAK